MKQKLFFFAFTFIFIFSSIFLFPSPSCFSAPAPATATATAPASVTTYDQLIHEIRAAKSASQARVEKAVEQEKVRECWEIGKLIDEHVLQHKERADYGDRTLKRLAEDLGMSHTELKYMLRFARTYPKGPPGDKLSWSHYRALLSVEDETARRALEVRAVKENWNRERMRSEVEKMNPTKERIVRPAVLGKLYTYRVIEAKAGENKGKLVLDLGFSNYFKPEKTLRFRAGDILLWEKNKLKKIKAGKEALFTYKADLIEIIDGDTFLAAIDLGFGVATVQKLRLKGLDAPEIQTGEGKEAKEFLAKELQKGPVFIKTVKSDKYDRYLVDIFVNDEYINQKILDEKFATVVEV